VGCRCGLKQSVTRPAAAVVQVMRRLLVMMIAALRQRQQSSLTCVMCSGGACKQLRVLGQEGNSGSAPTLIFSFKPSEKLSTSSTKPPLLLFLLLLLLLIFIFLLFRFVNPCLHQATPPVHCSSIRLPTCMMRVRICKLPAAAAATATARIPLDSHHRR
jgi:hypothetical protein